MKSQFTKGIAEGTVGVVAFYDPLIDSERDFEGPIFEYIFHFSPDNKKMIISDTGWKGILSTMVGVIEHELLHRTQARNRKFKLKRAFTKYESKAENVQAEQGYLGDSDEIEAYALSSAREIVAAAGNKEDALKSLRNFTKLKDVSPGLFMYMRAFGSPKHPVIKKVLKKIVLFINSS